MKNFLALIVTLALTGGSALAADVSGYDALALAARVAPHSPHLSAQEKALLAKYLAGDAEAPFPHGEKFAVTADVVSCLSNDVDITIHRCELTFGPHKVSFGADAAQALYATLIEAGVTGDAAAGSIYETVKKLDCAINPAEIKQREGAGAKCSFAPGP